MVRAKIVVGGFAEARRCNREIAEWPVEIGSQIRIIVE